MDLWELVARERIRDALARYNWSATRRDSTTWLNASARTASSSCAAANRCAERRDRRASRWRRGRTERDRRGVESPDEARVACYFTVFSEIGLDHFGRYRDVFVPVGDDWLIRYRFVSTDWSAPNSTMAR